MNYTDSKSQSLIPYSVIKKYQTNAKNVFIYDFNK